MKVKELAEKLASMPPEADVFQYSTMSEDQGDVSRVKLIDFTNPELVPYVKADYTMAFERAMETETPIVLIS